MAWHQLSMVTNGVTAPLIADFLTDLGAVSITYMDAKDQPVYEPAIGETKIWQQTQVISLFELNQTPELIQHAVSQHFENVPLQHQETVLLEDQVWERLWMEHYHPMKFANTLWVCPTGQEKKEAQTVCLTLDPGLAFGTGTHETTALCLEWLASHDLKEKIIIDYGCGSGILAIASVLLGAKQAYAVDIDPQAIIATQDNAQKNKVRQKISACLVDDFIPLNADIVIANILAKPLIELNPAISDLVNQGGQLILSGILNEQVTQVSAVYTPQFKLDLLTHRQDWVCLALTKFEN